MESVFKCVDYLSATGKVLRDERRAAGHNLQIVGNVRRHVFLVCYYAAAPFPVTIFTVIRVSEDTSQSAASVPEECQLYARGSRVHSVGILLCWGSATRFAVLPTAPVYVGVERH